MSSDPKEALRAYVRAAQGRCESAIESSREVRHHAFLQAREEGLSHSEIAAEVRLRAIVWPYSCWPALKGLPMGNLGPERRSTANTVSPLSIYEFGIEIPLGHR